MSIVGTRMEEHFLGQAAVPADRLGGAQVETSRSNTSAYLRSQKRGALP